MPGQESPNRKQPPHLGGLPKLNRGDELMGSLMPRIEAWLNSDPFSLDTQRSADYRQYRLHIRAEPDRLAPLVEWALVVGDILFNYRSALDHLVYTLAALETSDPEPANWRELAFPIADKPSRFRDMRNCIAGLPDDAKQRIEELQPFNSDRFCDTPALHPLARLRDLNNADKHRLLNFAVLTPRKFDGRFKIGDASNELPPAELWVSDQPLEDGAPIVMLTFEKPTNLDESDIHLSFRLRFYPSSPDAPMPTKSMPDELNNIREEVIRIVKELNPPLAGPPGAIPTAQ